MDSPGPDMEDQKGLVGWYIMRFGDRRYPLFVGLSRPPRGFGKSCLGRDAPILWGFLGKPPLELKAQWLARPIQLLRGLVYGEFQEKAPLWRGR